MKQFRILILRHVGRFRVDDYQTPTGLRTTLTIKAEDSFNAKEGEREREKARRKKRRSETFSNSLSKEIS